MTRKNFNLIQGLLNEIGIFTQEDQLAMDIRDALADEDIFFNLEDETTAESGNAITQFVYDQKEQLLEALEMELEYQAAKESGTWEAEQIEKLNK